MSFPQTLASFQTPYLFVTFFNDHDNKSREYFQVSKTNTNTHTHMAKQKEQEEKQRRDSAKENERERDTYTHFVLSLLSVHSINYSFALINFGRLQGDFTQVLTSKVQCQQTVCANERETLLLSYQFQFSLSKQIVHNGHHFTISYS